MNKIQIMIEEERFSKYDTYLEFEKEVDKLGIIKKYEPNENYEED